MFDEFAPKVGEDISGCFRGEESTQGVRERQGMTCLLKASKNLS